MKHPRFERFIWVLSVSAIISVWTNGEAPLASPEGADSVRTMIEEDKSRSQINFSSLLREIQMENLRNEQNENSGQELIVAVVDTGLDVNHPMIKNFLWSNAGETGLDSQGRDKSSNGVDDDANGFIDDIHGWNFVDKSNKVFDDHGHGTHISGIVTKNLSETSRIRIMVLKYYSASATGQQTLEASNQAIQYAIDQGARVINYSGGGDLPSFEEKSLFEKAFKKKILVVAASGNDGRKIDEMGFFPASYEFSNIISVGSTNSKGELLVSSNRGPDSVDFAAPGENITSSLPNQQSGGMTGTSQATAIVTSIVAKLIEESPEIQIEEIKQRLAQTSLPIYDLVGAVKNPGLPTERRALQMRSAKDFDKEFKLEDSQIKEVYDNPLVKSQTSVSAKQDRAQRKSDPSLLRVWP